MITGVDPRSMVDCMQLSIDKAIAWGRENGLTFGPSKTVVVIFTHRYKSAGLFPQLCVDEIPVPYSSSAKYLGIIFDSRLTFKDHIREKCRKAT